MRCHVPSCGGPVRCHGMSCFACGRRIACSRSGHGAVVSAWCSGYSIRVPRLPFSAWSLLSVRLRSVLPAAAPSAAGPFFAHNARRRPRARPRAYRGGAVRAPDCPGAPAREPDAGRTSPVGRIGGFSAPAPTRGEAAPDTSPRACSLFILMMWSRNASPSPEFFALFCHEVDYSGKIACPDVPAGRAGPSSGHRSSRAQGRSGTRRRPGCCMPVIGALLPLRHIVPDRTLINIRNCYDHNEWRK